MAGPNGPAICVFSNLDTSMKSSNGYTLVELLIVIAMILIAVVILSVLVLFFIKCFHLLF